MAEGIFVIIEQRVEALLFCVETAVCFLWRQKSFACPAYDGEGQSIAHRFHYKPQEKYLLVDDERERESDSIICDDEEVLLYDE